MIKGENNMPRDGVYISSLWILAGLWPSWQIEYKGSDVVWLMGQAGSGARQCILVCENSGSWSPEMPNKSRYLPCDCHVGHATPGFSSRQFQVPGAIPVKAPGTWVKPSWMLHQLNVTKWLLLQTHGIKELPSKTLPKFLGHKIMKSNRMVVVWTTKFWYEFVA